MTNRITTFVHLFSGFCEDTRFRRVYHARHAILTGVLALAMFAPFASGQSSADQSTAQTRAAMRDLVASARDAVFPALVHVEVQTASNTAGQEIRGMSTGSGTIIDASGLVLTNAHVTDEGRKFICTLSDKRRVAATLVGEDPWTDLALLRLDTSEGPFTPASLGDSNQVQTGDLVLAMGSPFALDRSVTMGIVSNPERVFVGGREGQVEQLYLGWSMQRTGLFTTWIQHDALINPGNSGGPLVNMAGEVIGVNTRGGQGNGFATPTSIARAVALQLEEHGQVDRSWVGVGFKHLDRTGHDEGVFVDWVDTDGPAAGAGVQAGDVITAVNGVSVTIKFPEQIPPLLRLISSQPIGSTLKLDVMRAGANTVIEVVTSELELDETDPVSLRRWGMTVSDITPYAARMYQLDTSDGIRIESTRSGMPAELAEPPLKGGDIIHGVNGEPTASIRDLVRIYTEITDDPDAPEYVIVGFDRWGDAMVTAIDTIPPDPSDPPRDLPKAWLGVETQPIVPELAKLLGSPTGFRVTRIYAGTTAAGSDLRVGDIVMTVGEIETQPNAIEQAGAFNRAVRLQTIGDPVFLKAYRNSETIDLPVTFERSPLAPEQAKRVRNRDFGLVVRALTFIDRVKMKLDDRIKGALVEGVEDGGWGSAGGLSSGDLILAIDDYEVRGTRSFEDAMEAVTEAAPDRVVFKVRRGNRVSFKFIEPEWSPQIEVQPGDESP